MKIKFEKFLQALPQADSDAAWPHTDIVHLAPIGRRRSSPYHVWILCCPEKNCGSLPGLIFGMSIVGWPGACA